MCTLYWTQSSHNYHCQLTIRFFLVWMTSINYKFQIAQIQVFHINSIFQIKISELRTRHHNQPGQTHHKPDRPIHPKASQAHHHKPASQARHDKVSQAHHYKAIQTHQPSIVNPGFAPITKQFLYSWIECQKNNLNCLCFLKLSE